jgi:SAM-dependent methyltransferase
VNSPLETEFGAIDVYLFDQLLRGRIHPGDRIVDAGCGFGRNLVYFLRHGFDVHGVDGDADAIDGARRLAASIAPDLPADRFRTEPVERSSFPDAFASVVISSAVLHFARDDDQFDAMLNGSWRLLAPGGLFFCRSASTIGMETRVRPLTPGSRRCRLPDGTDRYLVDEAFLMARTREMGGRLLDPIKTTVVQDQRSMTTWVVRKG